MSERNGVQSASEGTERIVDIRLDEQSVVRRAPEIEHERAVAIYDLLDMNRFRPAGDFTGPYKVVLSIEDGKRLLFTISSEAGGALTAVTLPLSPFRALIRDYFQICESYFDAIKKLSPSQIETIDMARRGLHNEGSDLLIERLREKIELDKATARRLFTLICVLHIRG
ncbi:UPF0262 family protein [Marivibrio halodurans]|uniref:UPF0262 protein KAJ83_02355 n=1 Tax=Marivibrio halodurans TaxID=2039722 RepID=A0A8J7S359_9PROT|nr:UPF0262 family protein [Marivibrio halodurans]MBP5855834.1 UPF0262 family protein [Marivibrio halodurans]